MTTPTGRAVLGSPRQRGAPAAAAVDPGVSCQHQHAVWNYYGPPRRWRRQRLIGTRPCRARPIVAHVTEHCPACGHHAAGYWCYRCTEDNEIDYRDDGQWCTQCNDWTIHLAISWL